MAREEALALASSLLRAHERVAEAVHGLPLTDVVLDRARRSLLLATAIDELSMATRCACPMLCPEGWLAGLAVCCAGPRLGSRPSVDRRASLDRRPMAMASIRMAERLCSVSTMVATTQLSEISLVP